MRKDRGNICIRREYADNLDQRMSRRKIRRSVIVLKGQNELLLFRGGGEDVTEEKRERQRL